MDIKWNERKKMKEKQNFKTGCLIDRDMFNVHIGSIYAPLFMKNAVDFKALFLQRGRSVLFRFPLFFSLFFPFYLFSTSSPFLHFKY